MSAQPLNTEITIYRTARSQRVRHGTDAVAVLIKHLRNLVMVVPGHEIMAGVLTRDTTVKDFSPYCGQASATAARGFPIVFGLKPVMSFAKAVSTVDNIDFPFVVGQDAFIKSNATGLAGDLYGDIRALDTGY